MSPRPRTRRSGRLPENPRWLQVYVVIIWNEYGHTEGGLAITHHEYRRAKANGLPILVFIKGSDEAKRSEDLKRNLLAEVKADGFKYKRFSNYRDLQTEVRAASQGNSRRSMASSRHPTRMKSPHKPLKPPRPSGNSD